MLPLGDGLGGDERDDAPVPEDRAVDPGAGGSRLAPDRGSDVTRERGDPVDRDHETPLSRGREGDDLRTGEDRFEAGASRRAGDEGDAPEAHALHHRVAAGHQFVNATAIKRRARRRSMRPTNNAVCRVMG